MTEKTNNQKTPNQDKFIITKKILSDKISSKLNTQIIFVIAVFLLIFTITIQITLPPYYLQMDATEYCPETFPDDYRQTCKYVSINSTNNWQSVITHINQKDQFIVIEGQAKRKLDYLNELTSVDIHYNAYALGMKNDQQNLPELPIFKKENTLVDKFQTQRIQCSIQSQICDFRDYMFFNNLNSEAYRLAIVFDTEHVSYQKFEGFRFNIYKGNDKIYNLLIGYRYSLLGLSIISFIIYYLHYRKIKRIEKIIEQKLIFFLSISLIFFNDFLYANTLLNPTIAQLFFSTLFVCQFIALLFYSLIIFVKRIQLNELTRRSKINQKILIVILVLYFCLLTSTTFIYNMNDNFDPSYNNYNKFSVGILVLFFTTSFITLGICAYIIFQLCWIFGAKKQMAGRFKNISFAIFIVTFYSLIIFIGGQYHYKEQYPERNIFYFFMMNFIVFYLQILYRQVKGKIKISLNDSQSQIESVPINDESSIQKQDEEVRQDSFEKLQNQLGSIKKDVYEEKTLEDIKEES